MSRDEGKLLDEDVFPHTYNPSTNLIGAVLKFERSQKESVDSVKLLLIGIKKLTGRV